MHDHTDDAIRYPVGRYEKPVGYNEQTLQQWITAIQALPAWLDPVVENLDEAQLETPYRPGGWNTRQVMHHLADSHMNAYIRLKLALTEDNPTVKPYDENLWAVLPDTELVPLNVSITLVHALHRRWVAALQALTTDQWERTYFHPESKRNFPIWEMTALYAWHGRHHMEQIRSLRNRMNWW